MKSPETNHPSAPDDTRSARNLTILGISLAGIALHLVFRFWIGADSLAARYPLYAVLAFGGVPLIAELAGNLIRREFGSDLLAGVSIITSVILGEYLAGAIVVLMLSGGETLEAYAMRSASSVLHALAKRMPSIAHRTDGTTITDIKVDGIVPDDRLVIYPHDICPVDGIVIEGHGMMNEAFLTGEPFEVTKAPGSAVISGSINGEMALVIRATRLAIDSRYAQISEVMRQSAENRPRLRRLGDQLGAVYTPLAILTAVSAAWLGHDATRFLSVIVVATPCPLLIAIPVSIIGTISLAAKRSIIIKNPVALEQISQCRTAIFDKTGTLTYGRPRLTDQLLSPGFKGDEVLALVASLEFYSKHPFARAILWEAEKEGLALSPVSEMSEPPGKGLTGLVRGRRIEVTSRRRVISGGIPGAEHISPESSGLECAVIVDGRFAAIYRLRDEPREDGHSFISHLGPKHGLRKMMILSGDRESEVRYLAEEMGIPEIHAEQSPEQKLARVRSETSMAKTLYLGDGTNDAPAMMAATVAIAIGQNSEVTSQAADVVILENTLLKVDEFMHISRRMRKIALQSAMGGMALSFIGMLLAAGGYLSPVAGAICQEAIDVLAVINALRAAFPPQEISDMV